MNVLVDSYGWIEYFADGKLADKYAKYVEKANKRRYFTPALVLYEVYKRIKTVKGEKEALKAYAYITAYSTIVSVDEKITLDAAEKSIETGLGMADAIVKAVAEHHNAKIITSDKHFKEFDDVTYISKGC